MSYRYNLTFFGGLMSKGLKVRAFNFISNLKFALKRRERRDPNIILLTALMALTQSIVLLPVRLGGRISGIPRPLKENKKVGVGVRLLFKVLREKKMSRKNSLPEVLIGSIYGRSIAIDKKQSIYQQATKNRHLIKQQR